jgi:hypothetical protein
VAGQAKAADTAPRAAQAAAKQASSVAAKTNPEKPGSSTPWLVYIVAAILAAITIVMIRGFFYSMKEGESLSVESNWGGFGGGGGGWRLSRPLTYLIGLMFSAGLLAAIAVREDLPNSPDSTTSEAGAASSTPASDEDTTSDSAADTAEDSL